MLITKDKSQFWLERILAKKKSMVVKFDV